MVNWPCVNCMFKFCMSCPACLTSVAQSYTYQALRELCGVSIAAYASGGATEPAVFV